MPIDFDDDELAVAILHALKADLPTAEAVVRAMVRGCEKIEEFERTLDQIKILANRGPVSMAAEHCRQCMGDLIDVFGDLLDIAMGKVNAGNT